MRPDPGHVAILGFGVMIGTFASVLKSLLPRFARSRRGNISVIMALSMIPVLGAVGMGGEATNWYLTRRAIQNAADSAVMAAVMNGCNAAATCFSTQKISYDQEAKSVATNFGFAPLANGDVTVTAVDNATCPAGGTCYQVTVMRKVPVSLLHIVGFDGDTTTAAGASAQTVRATAYAKKFPGSQYCVTAIAASDQAIRVNGGPDVNFDNCDAYTPNGAARCNGISGGGAFRTTYQALSTVNPCPNPTPTAGPLVDNFASLASSIPSSSGCVNLQVISSATDLNQKICSSTGVDKIGNPSGKGGKIDPITLTVATNTVLYLYDTQLDMSGSTIKTTSPAGMTIVFTGSSNSAAHNYTNSNNGSTALLDISSNATGTWKGVAIYQDPRLTGSGSNYDFNENKLNLKISGLFYAKNANVSVSGNLTFAQSGKECMALYVNTLLISGSVNVSTANCKDQGLTGLPQAWNLVNLVA
jgi:hypothetical protein